MQSLCLKHSRSGQNIWLARRGTLCCVQVSIQGQDVRSYVLDEKLGFRQKMTFICSL
jgi:hypothetical protein